MDINEQIEAFKEFFDDIYKLELYSAVMQGKRSFSIDFVKLAAHNPDLTDGLIEHPEDFVKAAEMAVEQFDLPKSVKNFRIRLFNLPNSQKLKIADIRSVHLGKFLWIESIVRQSSDIRPQVTNAKFECAGCGNTISILQIDQKFKEPSRCTCGWRGKFRLLNKDLVDVQHLKVEEVPEVLEGGEQPKRLSIFLQEDLVEARMEKRTAPGSKILVFGIVKEIPIQLKTGAQSTRYDIVMEANNVVPVQEDFSDITLSMHDIEQIREFAKDPRVYDKFTKSIAPSIYGHERIKQALVLQLMGGVRKVKEDGTVTRGDIHMLLIGDPGAGKSQLISFISKVAPKARFVSGKGSSGTGLTAAVVKDEFLKGWSLEAGALVLANKGIACVDELDKMTDDDRSALHEALEQQTITISKANIQATLRAETTMLAAANPKLGRFDPYAPIAAQINLPSTLINRFDLIFPIRDIPNKDKDEKIALHVLESMYKEETYATEISPDFLKKYLSYVKTHVHPVMTKAAINEIKDFYVMLRNSGKESEEGAKPIPISARQLEAVIRLSQASARVRLDDKVTRDDARRAIDLITYCLMQVGFDPETGQIDIDRMTTGISASTRNRITVVKEIIDTLTKAGIKEIPFEEIVAQAIQKGLEENKVEDVIEQLRRSGEIFEPKKGFIQKI